jgi:hypothetical protein
LDRKEGGYIVIETIGTFIPFLFLILSILSLINIVTVQARVHFALTQAAESLSMYFYAAEVTGVAKTVSSIDKNAVPVEEFRNNVSETIEALQTFSFDSAMDHADAAIAQIDEAVADPNETIRVVVNYGIDRSIDYLVSNVVRGMLGHYLNNGIKTGSEYIKWVETGGDSGLKSTGVIGGLNGFDFGDTDCLDEDGNITLSVQYEIDYMFNAIPLPFTKLKITQVVKTKAWLNGSGKGYKE